MECYAYTNKMIALEWFTHTLLQTSPGLTAVAKQSSSTRPSRNGFGIVAGACV